MAKGICIRDALKLMNDANRFQMLKFCTCHVIFTVVVFLLIVVINDYSGQFLQNDAILEALTKQPLTEEDGVYDTFETLTNAEDIEVFLKGMLCYCAEKILFF